MSAVAALFNIPTTQEEMNAWASAHMTHHRDINRAIYEQTRLVLPEFVLDPIELSNTSVWDRQHYIMHQNMDEVLGIAGFDLTGVDFQNRELLAGWIQLNANEHYQAANILGIG